jgi:hypothetical protein
MASTPPPQSPPTPEQAPTELPPPQPDTDVPDPGPTNQRSDLQQAVEARADAVARGEGGPEPELFTSPGLSAGEGGAAGVVRNQGADGQ